MVRSQDDVQLAVHGGVPVRQVRRVAQPKLSQQTRDEVLDVLERGALTRWYGGEHVRRFEEAFAAWFGRRRCVATNSGTSALHVAYVAAGIPEHAEVLVASNAYVSAVSALVQADLVPIPVDLDPHTWAMDPVDARRKIGPRTRGIVPVHMFGQPCDMTALTALADQHGLTLIEDCAQGHGGTWDGRLLGTFGQASCFSICCRKHVTSGEGGLLVTDDPALADRALGLTHKGKGERDWFDYRELGFSYGMTEIQAVIGRHGLAALADEVERRATLAGLLREGLAGLPLEHPVTPVGARHAYFKYNVAVAPHLGPWRDEIVDAIRAENVGVEPAHPYILDIGWLRTQQPGLFRRVPSPDYDPGVCPVARALVKRQMGIELGPGLDEDDLAFTVAAVRKVVGWYEARWSGLQRPQDRFV
jgi:perosamine synthetase